MNASVKNTEVLVIGAGLTGLTLAYHLRKAKVPFLVLERENRTGGAIRTILKDGFTFEKGPNTGVLGNEEVMDLFDEIGHVCPVKIATDCVKKRYVLKNGKWEALPSGLMGGIRTHLFTWGDKFRILGEPFRKPGTDPNETLAQLVLRRMGKSFLDYAVDPFILGIYAGDPSYLVPRHALPKLYNLEHNYGSFVGGSVKLAKAKKKSGIQTRATRKIFSVDGGLNHLTETLFIEAGKENFMTGISKIAVEPGNGGYIASGKGTNGEDIIIHSKRVVTTVGAHELTGLLPFLGPDLLSPVTNLKYAKVVQVSLGFRKWNGRPLDGFGGLIPHHEKRDVLGVLFHSASFPDRAPEGGALLSVFMGGVRRPEVFGLSGDQIRQMVEKEMILLMGLKTFQPDLMEISRYPFAIPQYGADCDDRFAAIQKAQEQFPGLIIGGNLRNGIGMADRIKQGKELAEVARIRG